ncbi:hypothetical protein BsWGS_16083 [Bradybaena similaris]
MKTLRLFVTLMMVGLCEAKIWEIPMPEKVQECYDKVKYADISTYVGSLFSWLCESKMRSSELGKHVHWDAKKISYYKHLLELSLPSNYTDGGAKVPRRKRQARRCRRREYRVLSDDERTRFHNAFIRLKRDTSVDPNRYDAIAELHQLAIDIAHGGGGFLGWHRLYNNMLESALQEVDPSVCLHYWDSSLDNELPNPLQSILWTPAFMGTPNGPVVDGPFAGWTTFNGGQLIRTAGRDGQLMTFTGVRNVLSRRRYEEIIVSTATRAQPQFVLENQHNGPHIYVGGAMNDLSIAPCDPIFFLHHSFIDYIFERFRQRLRNIGRNPEVYPNVVLPGSPHHSSTRTNFEDLNHADAYRDEFSQTFEYEPVPTCSASRPQCGSRYLTCRTSIGRCVPVTAGTVTSSSASTNAQNEAVPLALLPDPTITQSPVVPGTQLPGATPSDTMCINPEKSYGQAIQNDFCCDKICDTNEWVMIPVKIISVRPPKFNNYKSYPVHKGLIDNHYDIYSPRAYNQTNRFITQRRSNPKTYQRCERDESVGEVFLSSRGINYHGLYKEAAIVDQRQAVSISVGFVAVKKPTGRAKVSKALIRAHDSCGRVCQAACLDPLTGYFKECKGAIAVSAEKPAMYGKSYDEAVMSVFDYEHNNHLPQFKSSNFFITFYCDYQSNFPYTNYRPGEVPRPPVAVTPPAVVVPPSNTECQVTPQCILDVPCVSTERQCRLHGKRHICRGSCQAYAVCMYGRFFLRVCPEGYSFNNVLKICMPGGCQNNAVIGTQQTVNPNPQSARSYHSGLLSTVVDKILG